MLFRLSKSFSIASMKSSVLWHFVSFEGNNLDVVNFFLGGFEITLILPAVKPHGIPHLIALHLRRICDSDEKFNFRSIEYKNYLIAIDYKYFCTRFDFV